MAEAFSGTVCLLPTPGAESQALTGLSLGNREREQGAEVGGRFGGFGGFGGRSRSR